MSAHYTSQQWDLTNRVMDLVDQARQDPKAAWSDEDSRKVVALVEATYQSQGIAVEHGVVNKAMAVALKVLPTNQPHFSRALPSPQEDAQRLVQACAQRMPLGNADVAAAIARELDRLEPIHRKNQRRNFWVAGSSLAIGLSGIAATLILPVSFPLFPSVLVFPLLSVLGVNLMSRAVDRRDFDNAHRAGGEQALAALDRGQYGDCALASWASNLLPGMAYGWRSLLPLAPESELWQQAALAAEQDPHLFRAWGRWLLSPNPIREGDALQIIGAAQAVSVARKSLSRHTDDFHAQHAIRAQLLNASRLPSP